MGRDEMASIAACSLSSCFRTPVTTVHTSVLLRSKRGPIPSEVIGPATCIGVQTGIVGGVDGELAGNGRCEPPSDR